MRFLIRSLVALTAIPAYLLLGTGCSPAARLSRTLGQADQLFAASEYDRAEIEYKNALQLDGRNAHAIARLGLIYFDEGRIGTAVPFLTQAGILDPNNVDVRIKLGTIDLATGQLDEASNAANAVLDRDPSNPDAPLLLAGTISKPEEVASVRQRLVDLPPPAPEQAPVLLALGTLDFREQNFQRAEQQFLEAARQDPNSAAAQSALASLYFAQGQRSEGEAALRRAYDLAPPRSPRRLQYAQYKFQSGDLATAKSLLQDMAKEAPDYLPAQVSLAEIALSEKNFTECGSLLDKVLARDGALPEALILSSRLAIAQGDTDRAVSRAEEVDRLYPRSPAANYQLGLAYLADGQTSRAAANFDQALALSPGLTAAALALASLDLRRADYPAAITVLKQAVAVAPNQSQAWQLLAQTYRAKGDLDQALATYEDMDRRFQPGPETPFVRGLLALKQNETAEARTDFGQALAISPGYLPAVEQLTSLDLANQDFAAARTRIDAVIAASPRASGPYLLLARVQGAQSDTGGAEASLQRAIQLSPDDPTAYYLLANLYVSKNEKRSALENLQNLLARNPRDTQALMLAGILQDQLNDYSEARDTYEKLLAINPNIAAVQNNLAYLYAEHFDDLDKGYQAAQKARDLAPQDAHVADTLGWILYQRGQISRAVLLLEESAARLPDSPEVQYHAGLAEYAIGNADSARSGFERALALSSDFDGAATARGKLSVLNLDPAAPGTRNALTTAINREPNDALAIAKLAAIDDAAGDTEQAIASYEKSLQIAPGNTSAAIRLINLYAGRSELAQALELARNTRRLAPNDPEVARALGKVAYESGNFSLAYSTLQEAVRKLPENADVQYDFALAAYSQSRVNDARSAMENALKSDPNFSQAARARRFLELTAFSASPTGEAAADPDLATLTTDSTDVPELMALGTLSERSANLAQAEQAFEKVLTIFPGFSPAERRLAILYSSDPAMNQKVLDLGIDARNDFPDDPDLARALGIVTYRQGQFDRALTWLQQSVTRNADDAIAEYYLGMAQFQLKRTAPSRAALQKALSLGLPSDLEAEARRTLEQTP